MRNAVADDADDVLRGVADQRHLARLEDRVAVVHRRDHQVMHVGGEDQRDAEQREEIADQHALLVLRRVDRGDEAEAELLGDHRAGDLQRRDRQPRGQAEHRADDDFLHQHGQHRRQRGEIDGIGLLDATAAGWR